MRKIDITMTATLRPKLIKQTLESFQENLFYDNPERYRLLINVDPVGEDCGIKEILEMASKMFSTSEVIIPLEPSFPKAVIRTWECSTSEFCFHLEDDWLLNRRVDINHMINILDQNRHLACLRMYKNNISNKSIVTMFGSLYYFFL